MSLHQSSVHRHLEVKIKVVGLEAHDLIFILLFAAVMNLIFGSTSFALYFVFVLPLFMALALYFGKRNRPDNFLVHLLRYLILPGHFLAGSTAKHRHQMLQRIY